MQDQQILEDINMEEDIEWMQQLRQASWRDVPFQVDTVDVTAGQNTVMREYPFQDKPTVFSMGDAAEEIKLSAYVVGDDYLKQLDALREVLKGDGVLVHPTQGSIRCHFVGKYTIKEAPTSQGGIARLDLTFVRAEERRYPVGKANTNEQLIDAAAEARKSALQKFVEKFDASNSPGWSLQNMKTSYTSAMETVWDKLSTVQKNITYANNLVKQYISSPTTEIFSQVSVLGNMVSDVMKIPDNIESGLALNQFSTLRSMWKTSPSKTVADSYQTTGISTDTSASKEISTALTQSENAYQTPARIQEATNLNAINDLIEVSATISAIEALAQVDLENYDQALALRSDVNQQMMHILKVGAADHDVMIRLHTAVLADLRARSSSLSRLTTYTPETYQPVIYISYRLYGTVAYADEIMTLNPHIKNPLLAPPGQKMRVVQRESI